MDVGVEGSEEEFRGEADLVEDTKLSIHRKSGIKGTRRRSGLNIF